MPEFTPTQRRMLKLLSDGKGHSKHELKLCIDDELASMSSVFFHISTLRKKLHAKGEDIICTSTRVYGGTKGRDKVYIHVRLLSPDD